MLGEIYYNMSFANFRKPPLLSNPHACSQTCALIHQNMFCETRIVPSSGFMRNHELDVSTKQLRGKTCPCCVFWQLHDPFLFPHRERYRG